MKSSLFVVLALLASIGFAVDVPSMPLSEFADTEASTNFFFARHIDPSWNLVKVARRGLGVSCENVYFALVESGFCLTIR